MLWVYLTVCFMVVIFYFDQRIIAKKIIGRKKKERDEAALKWFNEIREENPEFYKKIFGDKDDMH